MKAGRINLKNLQENSVNYPDAIKDGFTIKTSGGKIKVADRIELNQMRNAFDIAVLGSLTEHDMIDGYKDFFIDESGIDTGASTNEDYDSGNDLYKPEETAALELDYMEYASDGAAQTAYVTSGGISFPTADLLDEDCSGIGDWTDGDGGDSVSQVNPAGQFEFDSNTSDGGAMRTRDIGTIPNTFTVEIKLYHDNLGTNAANGCFYINISNSNEMFYPRFGSDGFFTRDTDSGYTEAGTDLVKSNGSAEWQTWRFLVDFSGSVGDATCDVYLNDSTHDWEKVGTAMPCSWEAPQGDGTIRLRQYGYDGNDRITHVDYMKIATGLHIPSAPLESYSENSIINQGTYSLKAIAAITDSSNETLTKSGLSLDLTDKDTLKLDVRASRTGTGLLQVQLKQPAGYGSDVLTGGTPSASSFYSAGYEADKAVDDNESTRWDSANTPAPHWWKYDLGVAVTKTIRKLRYKAEGEYAPNAFKLQGSNNDSDWTDILSTNGAANSNWQEWTFSNSTAYRYYRIYVISCSEFKGYNAVMLKEIEMMEVAYTTHTKNINTVENSFQEITWDISGISNANKNNITQIIFKILNADLATTYYIDNFRVDAETLNMTLISQSETAEAQPDTARIVLFEEDVDSITLQTDLKAYVSRDGGTTYTQVTLSDEGDYGSGKRILTGTVDISGQPSGTSMKYRIETLNTKKLKLHGVGELWS